MPSSASSSLPPPALPPATMTTTATGESSAAAKKSSSYIAFSPSKIVYVSAPAVNIRKGPGLGYDKIAQVNHEDALIAIGADGSWYHIRSDKGIEGYVAGWLISEERL